MQAAIQSIERMFRAVETGDANDAEVYIASDYLNRESVDDGRSDKRGPEEFPDNVHWLREAFSDLHFENIDRFVCGDWVIGVTYMNGKHTGSFFGILATNRTFRQRQIHVFRIDQENQVTEHVAQRDDLGLRLQLTS